MTNYTHKKSHLIQSGYEVKVTVPCYTNINPTYRIPIILAMITELNMQINLTKFCITPSFLRPMSLCRQVQNCYLDLPSESWHRQDDLAHKNENVSTYDQQASYVGCS